MKIKPVYDFDEPGPDPAKEQWGVISEVLLVFVRIAAFVPLLFILIFYALVLRAWRHLGHWPAPAAYDNVPFTIHENMVMLMLLVAMPMSFLFLAAGMGWQALSFMTGQGPAVWTKTKGWLAFGGMGWLAAGYVTYGDPGNFWAWYFE